MTSTDSTLQARLVTLLREHDYNHNIGTCGCGYSMSIDKHREHLATLAVEQARQLAETIPALDIHYNGHYRHGFEMARKQLIAALGEVKR